MAPTERDQHIALFTKIYKPYESGAAHILSAALTKYDYPEYVPSVCATLLKDYPQLSDPLSKAHDTTTYKPLVDAVLNLAVAAPHFSRAFTSTNVSDPNEAFEPDSDLNEVPDKSHNSSAFVEIPSDVNAAIDAILPSLAGMLSPGWRWPSWVPNNVSASDKPEIHSWLSNLEIPVMNNEPSLLLHQLGTFQDDSRMEERVHDIFLNAKKPTLLVNSSGTGKTRHMLEALCEKWGFYFCSTTASDQVGSTDIMDCIETRLVAIEGFTRILPCEQFTAKLKANREIAADCITQVLLARLLVFQAFLDAIIRSGRKITKDDKLRWVYLQINPSLVAPYDIFTTVAQMLNRHKFTAAMCEEKNRSMLVTLTHLINNNVGSDDARVNAFHCVLDEAQYAANHLSDAFRSASDNSRHWRSVLRELIVALRKLFSSGVGLTIGGTGIDKNVVEEVLDSVIGKNSTSRWLSSTGSFDKTDEISCATQQSYIKRYIPESIMRTDDGRRLLHRVLHWLGGRFRFTASFLANLITSDLKNPNQFLSDWVEYHTGFRPTDAPDLTMPFRVTTVFSIKKLYEQINFDKMDSVQGFSGVLTDAVYESLLRSGIASSFSGHDDLMVQCGFAQYTQAGCSTPCISEPMILLAATYYINERKLASPRRNPFGNSIWQHVVRNIGKLKASRYNGFETYLAFLLADAFATPVPLKDVFEFSSPAPGFADQSARLVALSKGPESLNNELHVHNFNWRERAISAGRIGETCDVEGTLEWLNHEREAPFCFPDDNMGPDLIFVLQLDSKELIWVALQAKFLAKEIDSGGLRNAIRTTVPDKYFVWRSGVHYSKETRPTLVEKTQAALTLAGGADIGTKYPLLRVVVVSPPTAGINQLDAHIDKDAAKLSFAHNHHDPDRHPLVALNWKKLLATTTDPDQRFLPVFENPVERDANPECKPGEEEEKRKRSGEDEHGRKRQKTAKKNATKSDRERAGQPSNPRTFQLQDSTSGSSVMRYKENRTDAGRDSVPSSSPSMGPSTLRALSPGGDGERDNSPWSVSAASSPAASRDTTGSPEAIRSPTVKPIPQPVPSWGRK
ncbi:hypothetical protein DFH06DRAFT_1094526 [Mycena polygramma]|nr:hypothetical protein DFH06DRAFT_1094526 [Mycena polygramma]